MGITHLSLLADRLLTGKLGVLGRHEDANPLNYQFGTPGLPANTVAVEKGPSKQKETMVIRLRDLDKDHNHPWMNNVWYRYVYDRVHAEDNYTDCYVCSHMPTTAIHATIYGKPPTKSEALCIYDKAITGNCSLPGQPVMVIGGSIKDQSMETCQNGTRYIVPQQLKYYIYNFTNCTHYYPNFNYTCNERYWVHLNVNHRTMKSFSVSLPPDVQHPVCFNFTGETGPGGARTNLKKLGKNRNCSIILTAPDWHGNGSSKGTYWVQGAAWACGPKTYFMLPPNSTGLCAPVLVSDHTFKINPGSTSSTTRHKRDASEMQARRKRRTTPRLNMGQRRPTGVQVMEHRTEIPAFPVSMD